MFCKCAFMSGAVMIYPKRKYLKKEIREDNSNIQ